MVGGRREEGSMVIKNTNVFAALETLRKKKKIRKFILEKIARNRVGGAAGAGGLEPYAAGGEVVGRCG